MSSYSKCLYSLLYWIKVLIVSVETHNYFPKIYSIVRHISILKAWCVIVEYREPLSVEDSKCRVNKHQIMACNEFARRYSAK